MKMRLFVIAVMGMLMCFPLFSLQIKTESNGLYREEGHFEEDYMFSGNELEFAGSAMDLFFAGRKLVFEGSTYSGVYAVGETVVINGTVGNDFFSGASRLEINGKINGTLFMASGECTLSSDSVVDGNIFMISGNTKLNGAINGNIYVGSGVFTISGTVNGDVEVGAGDVVITEKGKVNGNFKYYTENKLNESEESRITGTIDYTEHDIFKDLKKEKILQVFKVIGIIFTILGFLSILGFGLLLLLLPCFRNFDYAGSHNQFWYYLVYGLIPFFIYPMVIIVLMILIITIPFAFTILLAALPILFVTQILGIAAFGQYLFMLFKWKNTNRFLYLLFGFIFFVIINLIPIIKILGIIFFSCIGWGIILEKVFKKKFANNGMTTADNEMSTEQV